MMLPASYHTGFAPRDGYPAYPELWRGCVGAWAPCLGPTGLTLRDWSGRQNHGTLTNMVPGDDWVVGGGRYALDFDGTDDYASVPVLAPARGFSFTCWMRSANASRTRQSIFSNSTDASPDIYLHVESIGGGTTQAMNFYNGSGYLGASSSFTMDLNWHHYAWTTNQAGQVAYYRDGLFLGTAASTWTPINDASLAATLGGIVSLLGSGFNLLGQLDDCRRYDRTVTHHEIQALATRRGIAYETYRPTYYAPQVTSARRRKILTGQV